MMLGTLLSATLASACPDCPPAREARALVLGSDFLLHLTLVLAPFVATMIAVVWIATRVDRPALRGGAA